MSKFRLTLRDTDIRGQKMEPGWPSLVVVLNGDGTMVLDPDNDELDVCRWAPGEYEVRSASYDLDAADFGPVHATVQCIVAGLLNVDVAGDVNPQIVLEPGDSYADVDVEEIV